MSNSYIQDKNIHTFYKTKQDRITLFKKGTDLWTFQCLYQLTYIFVPESTK